MTPALFPAAVTLFLALALFTASLVHHGIYVFSLGALILLAIRLFYPPRQRPDGEEKCLLGIFFWAFLSAIPQVIMDLGFTGRALDHSSRFLLVGLIFTGVILGRVELRGVWLRLSLLLAGIGSGVYALVQFYLQDIRRVSGGVNVNSFGNLTGALFLVAITFLFFADRGKWLLLSVLAIPLAGLAVFLTGLRANWLAVILVTATLLATMLVRRDNKMLYQRLLLALGLCLGLGLAIFLLRDFRSVVDSRLREGMSDISVYQEDETIVMSTSIGARLVMWKLALRYFQESPLLGLGLKQRQIFHQQLVEEGFTKAKLNPYGTLHNELLNAMAMRGILGLSAILLLYGVPLVFFLRRWRSPDPEVVCPALSGLGVVLLWIIFGYANEPLYLHVSTTFYGLLIMVLAVGVKQAERRRG
ncbi:MAG: O-antigen ligase family protein [Planctomycetota bacterium]|jgi:O-antigen ligase|nr:O-antigen ligase family protein [Planctomycetota bacterium]